MRHTSSPIVLSFVIMRASWKQRKWSQQIDMMFLRSNIDLGQVISLESLFFENWFKTKLIHAG